MSDYTIIVDPDLTLDTLPFQGERGWVSSWDVDLRLVYGLNDSELDRMASVDSVQILRPDTWARGHTVTVFRTSPDLLDWYLYATETREVLLSKHVSFPDYRARYIVLEAMFVS